MQCILAIQRQAMWQIMHVYHTRLFYTLYKRQRNMLLSTNSYPIYFCGNTIPRWSGSSTGHQNKVRICYTSNSNNRMIYTKNIRQKVWRRGNNKNIVAVSKIFCKIDCSICYRLINIKISKTNFKLFYGAKLFC